MTCSSFLQLTYKNGELLWVIDRHLSWVPFMNFARCREEQNVELVWCEGGFLFRTLQDIADGEELRVWPTSILGKRLGIPESVAVVKTNGTFPFLFFSFFPFSFAQSFHLCVYLSIIRPTIRLQK